MYTSIAMLALSSLLGAIPQERGLVWESDYARAYKLGRTQKRPLAVFIGSGVRGFQNVAEDGSLTKKMRRLLAENYVCVYVDTSRESGKELARAFRVSTGLVLSDRAGVRQAFRHEGTLPGADMVSYLERFANPNLIVQGTTTHTDLRTTTLSSSSDGGFQRSFGRSC